MYTHTHTCTNNKWVSEQWVKELSKSENRNVHRLAYNSADKASNTMKITCDSMGDLVESRYVECKRIIAVNCTCTMSLKYMYQYMNKCIYVFTYSLKNGNVLRKSLGNVTDKNRIVDCL